MSHGNFYNRSLGLAIYYFVKTFSQLVIISLIHIVIFNLSKFHIFLTITILRSQVM
jgi:hypothetical protein